jgi:hypothetical protein
MEILKRLTFNNNVFAQVLLGIIIILSVCYIGYMVGQFAWYLSK